MRVNEFKSPCLHRGRELSISLAFAPKERLFIIMGKRGTIPEGYMTVGELAKKMNTTVRTLQYYDREGLLSPSAESEGKRRLYVYKDMVKLHQIQAMKFLGFSLDDIKNRLVSLDAPDEVARALSEQAEVIRKKIASLSKALEATEKLRDETLKIDTVDWAKYADIIVLMQMGSEEYGYIKYFGDKTLNHVRSRFDHESGQHILSTWKRLCDEAIKLNESGVPAESVQGQTLAKEWWDMINEFTGGDMTMIPELAKIAEQNKDGSEKWDRWTAAEGFLTKAMDAYFTDIGIDPFEGAGQ